MKVFLSWSGEISGQVARALRDWLPYVINSIQPYVSSEDIHAGKRWGAELARELDSSTFGILCVTPANLGSPWLNFEAGALSKALQSADGNCVCPFLFGLSKAQLSGPLEQFQSITYSKAELEKLVFSLNAACGAAGVREAHRLTESFNVWWPKLQDALDPLYRLVNKRVLWLFESATQSADAEISELETLGYGTVTPCYLDQTDLTTQRPACDLAIYNFGKTKASKDCLNQITDYLGSLNPAPPLIAYTYYAAGNKFLSDEEVALFNGYAGKHVMSNMPQTLLNHLKTIG